MFSHIFNVVKLPLKVEDGKKIHTHDNEGHP